MAEIIFQSRTDAIMFYHHLLKCLNMDAANEEILLHEDQKMVKVLAGSLSADFYNRVKQAIYAFIIEVKREDWFREIIRNQFFYEDLEEQQQILEILHSILEGQREDLTVFLKNTNNEPFIREAIHHVLQDNISFSFDSFLKFRLRDYMKYLENYVEVAIDEFKLEQEYQMFIYMLRDFLANREPKIETMHLLFDEEITFYDEWMEEIKRSDLTKMIDRKLLVNHPVYVDSSTIAPLLSLAPKKIFLYTNNDEAPLVRTIKNIFEERVIIKTHSALRHLKYIQENLDSSENQA
ncbi:putative sporulation protein YtxC [Bacillus sp. BRMEA1]|uniref:putative sporulation protein YtxC n=1 Tax=Neobacillus endophyticus TaxID=2738405 RepID=UPI001564EAC1|nr:putative sporulation protein YtxC [Neobacillus endophyticus]NRD76072.1 putative sporulation protein YtxC [Neobacillus endophyticus]